MIQNNIKIQELFFTSDLGLSTAISLFYPIELIDKTNPSKAVFSFKRYEGLEEVIQLYWKGELEVNVLAFYNQLKVIKSRLYSGG